MPNYLDLTDRQLYWAKGLVAGVVARGLPVRAAHIVIETALTESALRMYANGNNRRSLQLSHDAVGWDHGSVGLLQQQVGGAYNSTANWGTTDELMNATISCEKFLNALGRVNWRDMTNWSACQSVQRSAFSDGSNYRRNDAWAIRIGNALWNSHSSHSTASSDTHPLPVAKPKPGTMHYKVAGGDTMSSIAGRFHMTLIGLEALNPHAGHPAGNFNAIRAGDVLVVRGLAAVHKLTVAKPTAKPTAQQQQHSARRTHIVVAGDTFGEIAAAWHVTVAALTDANPHSGHPSGNVDNIWPGDCLVLPGSDE